MIVKYLVPLLAVLGIAFAVRTVIQSSRPPQIPPPVVEPARAPFESYIAASGIVEAASENIAIAATVAGVVTDVDVAVGSRVKKGDPLFRIDARELAAQVQVAEASARAAEARLERLRQQPRAEELRVAKAHASESDRFLEQVQKEWGFAESAQKSGTPKEDGVAAGVLSREEMNRRWAAVQLALARRDAAAAELDLTESGAWKPDVAIAEAELAQVNAQLDTARTQLERLTVRAPIDGTVLKVDVRPGEYAAVGPQSRTLMLLGDVDVLHVRADIDENDAWRYRPGSRAVAFVRGNRALEAELADVRVEPYVVPKKSLTGDSTERVDTRVLQVVFRFDPARLPAYVGQQVDVFVEAPPIATAAPARAPQR